MIDDDFLLLYCTKKINISKILNKYFRSMNLGWYNIYVAQIKYIYSIQQYIIFSLKSTAGHSYF